MKQWVHNNSVSAHAQYYIRLHHRSTAAAGLKRYCRLLNLYVYRPAVPSLRPIFCSTRPIGKMVARGARQRNRSATAFPALRPLAPSRRALARGSFTPSQTQNHPKSIDPESTEID